MKQQNTVTLQLGAQRGAVWINDFSSGRPGVQLDLGWSNVLPGPLHTSPPRPIDLETAIQNIEEHVMPLSRIIPAGSSLQLACAGMDAPDLLSAMPIAANVYSLDEFESVFGRLCAIAEGSPAGANNLLIEPATAASLLIIRELMHHARLQSVSL